MFFLIEKFYIADSQPDIPTTMATLVIKKSASSKILSPTVKDELDSLVNFSFQFQVAMKDVRFKLKVAKNLLAR